MGYAPARALLDAGAGLVIASDWNPGSAPMGHLLCQAALLGAAEKLSHAEVLAGISYRAAAALALTDRGVLSAGKNGRYSFVSHCPLQKYSIPTRHDGSFNDF